MTFLQNTFARIAEHGVYVKIKKDFLQENKAHFARTADRLWIGGYIMSEHEKALKTFYDTYLQHIRFDHLCNDTVRKAIGAVVDMQEEAIIAAIINFAKDNHIADVFLLDREFVISAIRNEAERKNALFKVGDTVYQTDGARIYESTIRKVIFETENIAFDENAIGNSVFLSRQDAEKALENQ